MAPRVELLFESKEARVVVLRRRRRRRHLGRWWADWSVCAIRGL